MVEWGVLHVCTVCSPCARLGFLWFLPEVQTLTISLLILTLIYLNMSVNGLSFYVPICQCSNL